VSIRTTAATFVRALRYLPVAGEPFHIRRWVHDERQNGWMFLNAQRDQIDSVRSILSAWLEVFANALTSLPPSRSRRVWLIIDELHSLNRIPSLAPFLAESRKYGGCGVIAFHQVAQLRERYGRDGAEALTGACATWVCMRQNDPETAKWIANSFGQVEVYEAHQGLTYGANDMRDGVSLSRMRKQRPVLLDSEISQLDNLEGYIRLPGPFPMGRFRQRWRAPKIVAEAFVPAQRSMTGDAALFPDASAADLPPLDTAELQPAGLFDEPAPMRGPAESTSVAPEEVV
jgi:type IV secretory pathway TraG/TraD family ATPase VirD4